MTCPLTDTELNAWCAELCRVGFEQDRNDAYLMMGCEHIFAEADWNPCTDRNQAQLVVERMLSGSFWRESLEQLVSKAKFSVDEFEDDPDYCGWHDCQMRGALLLSPRQICEASWEAMND